MTRAEAAAIDAGLRAHMLRIYNYMVLGLAITGVAAFGVYMLSVTTDVAAAAKIILELQTIVSREVNPTDAAVVTVGSIHGGTKHNIIPSEVKLQLTVRTMTDASRKTVLEGIARIVKAYAPGGRRSAGKL